MRLLNCEARSIHAEQGRRSHFSALWSFVFRGGAAPFQEAFFRLCICKPKTGARGEKPKNEKGVKCNE